MTHHVRRPLLIGSVAVSLLGSVSSSAAAADRPPRPSTTPVPGVTGNLTGAFPDGAMWTIDVPTNWNGTLLLFSHGLVPPGQPNPAVDAPDPATAAHLLGDGYALAGSSYAAAGWVPKEALADQTAVLDVFTDKVGRPSRTVAWGPSLGGMISAALVEQYPDRIAGALPMCGLVAGSVGLWDTYLDTLYALTTLLGPDLGVALVHVTDPFPDIERLATRLGEAQLTPQGRARIALAAALGNVPGRAGGGSAPPDPHDVNGREAAQLENLGTIVVFGLALRADMEGHVGGNPSTNVGIDYGRLVRRSSSADEVEALYQAAGLRLRDDLSTLAKAPRIAADPAARTELGQFFSFDGALGGHPVLTLHTSDDPLVGAQSESAYRDTVKRAGDQQLLRQAFTDRAGHCLFTPAEMIAALETLIERIDTGHWAGTAATQLNAHALQLGPAVNVHFDDSDPTTPVPTSPAFTNRKPGPFLRTVTRARQ
jgi:hypothetical protein